MGANEPETVTIFHLRRQDGQCVFLHPFDDSRRLIDILSNAHIEGRYGREPAVRPFTLFREKLYKMIDDGLRSLVSETYRIPHSLASGAMFLSVYLLSTIILRSRSSMWAAPVIAFAAALLTYFALEFHEMRSETVVRRRQILRARVDRVYFRSDLFVLEVEHELAHCDQRAPERIADAFFGEPRMPFVLENDHEARQLTAYLEQRFGYGAIRRHVGRFPRFLSPRAAWAGRGLRLARRWLCRNEPDPALYALYREVKKGIEASTGNEGR